MKPELDLFFLPDVEYLSYDKPQTINGTLKIRIPTNASCGSDLAYELVVEPLSSFVRGTVTPANGTIPASEHRDGQNVTRGVKLTIAVQRTPEAYAYQTAHVRVRLKTLACGTDLEAGEALAQTGARVGLVLSVKIQVVGEKTTSWSIEARNEGNSAVRVDWSFIQPALGRLVEGSQQSLGGPDRDPVNTSGRWLVGKVNMNRDYDAVLIAYVVYEGWWPAVPTPFERLPNLVLWSAGGGGGPFEAWGQYALLAAAFALLAGGVYAGWKWKRKPPPSPPS